MSIIDICNKISDYAKKYLCKFNFQIHLKEFLQGILVFFFFKLRENMGSEVGVQGRKEL